MLEPSFEVVMLAIERDALRSVKPKPTNDSELKVGLVSNTDRFQVKSSKSLRKWLNTDT